MPARRMRGPSAHQTGPSPSQTRVGVHKNVWPAGTTGTSANQRIMRFLITLSYTRTMCLSPRSEEHTSELQSLMRISYAVLCLKKQNTNYRRFKLCRLTYHPLSNT